MPVIYPAGSDVAVKTVGFNDLEAVSAKNDSFFVARAPVGKNGPGSVDGAGTGEKEAPEAGAAGGKAAEASAAGRKNQAPSKRQVGKDATPPPEASAPSVDLEAEKEAAYAKGKKDGRAEAEKKFQSAARSLAAALEEVNGLRASVFEKSREDMLRLVMAVSRQVIRTEARENRDVIAKTIANALEAAVPSEEYYVRIHPADMEAVLENKPLFLASMKGLQNIHFTPDESISRGGAAAESRAGDVDATIESQLETIYEHLRYEIIGGRGKTGGGADNESGGSEAGRKGGGGDG